MKKVAETKNNVTNFKSAACKQFSLQT